mgnify:CR=1 FL=1
MSEEAKWYVVHTYSGYENKVKEDLEKTVENRNLQDMILEVKYPTEEVVEIKDAKRKVVQRKVYPGYVMIRMIMTDLSCHLVQSIPKVTGFVGGKNRPTPMSESDAARILSLMESRQETPRPKFNFERGDDVRVIEGPFEGFNGVVDDVNYEKGKLRVSVSIFGRQTPVELDFVQVSKG